MKRYFCISLMASVIFLFQNCGENFNVVDFEEYISLDDDQESSSEVEKNSDFNAENREIDEYLKAFVSLKATKKTSQKTFQLYLSTKGNDRNNGTSLKSAIKTLMRAQSILKSKKPRSDVEILISPGVYYNQSVKWTYVNDNYKVTIKPRVSKKRPKFIGCKWKSSNCKMLTWFNLYHSKGTPSNIHIKYIHIENYSTAISLNGSRGKKTTSNSKNVIYGCYFKNIGNVFAPALNPSTAAVRLVNSKNNLIRNNHFVNIINTKSQGLLHAVYVAHYSTSNDVIYNRFHNVSGSTVRVRDASNDNLIANNKFSKVNSAAYEEWYCDKLQNRMCTKPAGECPSEGNWFKGNTLYNDKSEKFTKFFTVRGLARHKLCNRLSKKRLRTALNKRR